MNEESCEGMLRLGVRVRVRVGLGVRIGIRVEGRRIHSP